MTSASAATSPGTPPGAPASGDRARPRSTIAWFVLAVVGVAAAATFAISGARARGLATLQPQDNPSLPVAELTVSLVEVQKIEGYAISRRYSGEVRAAATTRLAFEAAEPIVELTVSEGDTVAAGQVLARLDTSEIEADLAVLRARLGSAAAQLSELEAGPRQEVLAAAAARVSELEQRLELAELTARRRRTLVAGRHVPEDSADEAEFEALAQGHALEAARQELAELTNGTRPERILAAEARVDELAASVARSETDLADAELKAPFDGVIGAVLAELGSNPGPGVPVLEVVQSSDLEAWIGLPVEVCSRLAPDSPHVLQLSDGRTVQGSLRARLPRLDTATRTRTLLFTLGDLDLTQAIPGQRVDLQLEEFVETAGFWLPLTALVRSRRGLWAAYAIAPTEGPPTVERRELELLHTTGEFAFVRGLLQPGERLVRNGVQRLVEGQRVALGEVETIPSDPR